MDQASSLPGLSDGEKLADQSTIVILDDEPAIQVSLKITLARANYRVLTVGSYEEFIECMTGSDVVLCDIILPGRSGLEALQWTRQHYPQTQVIVVTGEPSYETAARAIRLGAYDYLAKPIHPEELLSTVARAVEHRRLFLAKKRLEAENEAYRRELEQRVAERTEALRESEQFLTSLANTMADVVFSLTMPDGRVEYVNQAVTSMFGYRPEELLGQPVSVLYPDQTSFEIFARKQTAAIQVDKLQTRLEQLLRHKDGRLIWTEMAISFIYTENKVIRAISVVRDITQRSLLLGVVAHELRSPLALLSGFSEVLLGDVENVDQTSLVRYLDTMQRTATRLIKILDELLEVAEIDLGQLSLDQEIVNLSELLQAHVNDYYYLAHRKNISLNLSLPDLPLECYCDPVKIGQVISNFIDNAVKYSPPHTRIEVIGERNPHQVWVGIRDQGPGIKADEMEHLFKSFAHTRVSSKPTGGEKSTGLGLAICKRIVEAHQGKVGVTAAPEQGSTFWFSLPLQLSAPG